GFLFLLVRSDDLLLYVGRNEVVVTQRHRIRAAAPGYAFELAVVLRDFGERDDCLYYDHASCEHILADDASAFGRHVTGYVTHILGGDGYFHVDNGFEEDGFCLLDGVDERALAVGAESDFLGVDGVMLAVVDGYLYIL